MCMGRNVEDWLSSKESDEWSIMMRKVAAFHHKHDFAGNNGHDMGYRIALTVEELGELAAAVTKGKPIEECAEEMAERFREQNEDYIISQQLLWKHALRKSNEDKKE